MCSCACFVKAKASLIFFLHFSCCYLSTRELYKGNMKRDGNKRLLLAIRILGRYLILAASVSRQLESFLHLGTCLG